MFWEERIILAIKKLNKGWKRSLQMKTVKHCGWRYSCYCCLRARFNQADPVVPAHTYCDSRRYSNYCVQHLLVREWNPYSFCNLCLSLTPHSLSHSHLFIIFLYLSLVKARYSTSLFFLAVICLAVASSVCHWPAYLCWKLLLLFIKGGTNKTRRKGTLNNSN
jgi:hypothetical protein